MFLHVGIIGPYILAYCNSYDVAATIWRCEKVTVALPRSTVPMREFFYYFLNFIQALFQFGLPMAPIQNTGLNNTKYNNPLYIGR